MMDQPQHPPIRPQLRIVDLLGAVGGQIKGERFINCDLVGPAVLVFHGSSLNGVNFDVGGEGGPDVLFIELPADQPKLGLVSFENCVFVNCRFTKCAIAAPPEEIARLKRMFSGQGIEPPWWSRMG